MHALVENMVKKNRNRYPIAVLFTTLICSHKMNAYLFLVFDFTTASLKMGACNILLERSIQDLSSGILKAPKFLKFQLVNQKKQICIRLVTVNRGGQKTCNGKMPTGFFYHVFYHTRYDI